MKNTFIVVGIIVLIISITALGAFNLGFVDETNYEINIGNGSSTFLLPIVGIFLGGFLTLIGIKPENH